MCYVLREHKRIISIRNRLNQAELLILKIKKTTLQVLGGDTKSPTRGEKPIWSQIFPQQQSIWEDKGAESSKLCRKGETKTITPRDVVPIYKQHGKGQGK